MELSGKPWRDPAMRHARKTEWQNWAQKKYRALAHGRGLEL
jgi:hypothetical protein